MRIRLPLGRSLFFGCAVLFALVALLPLRLALDWIGISDRGLTARSAVGSIWLGALQEARIGPLPLGNMQAGLRTLPLLIGRARVDLERSGEGEPLRGAVTVSRHSFGLEDVRGRLDATSLFAPLPITYVDMDNVSVRFENDLCAVAEGQVEATVAGQFAGLPLPGAFSGQVRCDGGAALLPLASPSGRETLNLRLSGNGRLAAELVVRPADPGLAQRLAAAGFTPTADGAFTISTEKQF